MINDRELEAVILAKVDGTTRPSQLLEAVAGEARERFGADRGHTDLVIWRLICGGSITMLPDRRLSLPVGVRS
jgi:hypothetical protein